jgi:hypothetical protein
MARNAFFCCGCDMGDGSHSSVLARDDHDILQTVTEFAAKTEYKKWTMSAFRATQKSCSRFVSLVDVVQIAEVAQRAHNLFLVNKLPGTLRAHECCGRVGGICAFAQMAF